MVSGAISLEERARQVVAAVADPEIPVLTIEDLGILRSVRVTAENRVAVVISPTYSGCPAIEAIRVTITESLQAAGFDVDAVTLALAPAWSPDWMSEDGRRKLLAYGIAPPVARSGKDSVPVTSGIGCPNCGSTATAQSSRFGPTPCKSIWKCRSCEEVFEHFKCL